MTNALIINGVAHEMSDEVWQHVEDHYKEIERLRAGIQVAINAAEICSKCCEPTTLKSLLRGSNDLQQE